jgi:hypothetical protein
MLWQINSANGLLSSLEIAMKGQPFQLTQIAVDYSTNNNIKRIVVNLLENDCLEQVFNKITKEDCVNRLSEMIRKFDNNADVTIIMREDNTLASDTYGICKGVFDEQNNFKYYLISLNPTALTGVSEDKIANTMFHEFIHAYLKDNLSQWDFENNTAHSEMLANYLDYMAISLNTIFGTALKDAYCLAYSGLFDDETPIEAIQSTLVRSRIRQKLIQQFQDPVFGDEALMEAVVNQYLSGGNKGTRTNNCQ